jgi:hypothetical protein
MLAASRYSTPAFAGVQTFAECEKRIEGVAEIGWWISDVLEQETMSRVGRAMWRRRECDRKEREGMRRSCEEVCGCVHLECGADALHRVVS